MAKPKKKSFSYVVCSKYGNVMRRCYSSKDSAYKNYGGRGIKVHGPWIKDINVFKTWILNELEAKGISVDDFILKSSNIHIHRVDNDGHYTPDNCVLVTAQENSRAKAPKKKLYISSEGERIYV